MKKPKPEWINIWPTIRTAEDVRKAGMKPKYALQIIEAQKANRMPGWAVSMIDTLCGWDALGVIANG